MVVEEMYENGGIGAELLALIHRALFR